MPAPRTATSSHALRRYGLALAFTALAALLRWFLPDLLTGTPYLAFYPAVVAAAAFGGFGPGALATICSFLVVDLVFDTTPGRVRLHDPAVLGRMAIFLAGGLGTAVIAGMQRASHARERQQVQVLAQLTDLGQLLIRDEQDRILRWSEGCAHLYGFSAKQAVGRISHELLQTQFPQPLEAIQATLRQKGRWEGELVHRRADGQSVTLASLWVLRGGSDGTPPVILEVNNDITERKRAEEERLRAAAEVARQKELLAVTLASIGDAVIVTDAQGRITFLNGEAERLTGWKSVEAAGQQLPVVFRIINEESRQTVESPVDKVLRLGMVVGLANHTLLIAKDGREIPIDDSGAPIRHTDGTVQGVVLVFRDFTERKAVETSLAAAKVSAEQASAAKDHFLAVLSHELRTPLTPVLTAVAMLQEKPELDSEVQGTLEMVRRNIELEAHLIDDLLDLTRIVRGKIELQKQRVDLCTVLARAVEVCRSDIEARGLYFGVDIGPDAPYQVEVDSARLQQVLWNLLKNAIKFTPKDGCVGIRCRAEEGHVVVEVNDSGIGIEAQDQGRIFDAFEQADRSISRQFGGLGLGLAISKALVELHGGTISAHSEGKNKGASFRIRLPLAAAGHGPVAITPEGHRVPQPTPPRPASRPLRILLVEDHGDTAKMMRLLLGTQGHKVTTAGDVATALQLAQQHAFDLLLSDLGLPDGSGHDLMRELRERGHTMPSIALSGYGQEQDIQRSREAGFSTHLIKPTNPDLLARTIDAVTRPGVAH